MAGPKGKPQPRGAERVQWAPVLERAATIVNADPVGMALRGLFYRLVSEGRLRNTRGHYKTLSARTAEARRAGWFPSHRPGAEHPAPGALLRRRRCAHERSRCLPARPHRRPAVAVYLGVEKNALVGVIESRFRHLGVPVLASGGYGSQTFMDDVVVDVREALTAPTTAGRCSSTPARRGAIGGRARWPVRGSTPTRSR